MQCCQTPLSPRSQWNVAFWIIMRRLKHKNVLLFSWKCLPLQTCCICFETWAQRNTADSFLCFMFRSFIQWLIITGLSSLTHCLVIWRGYIVLKPLKIYCSAILYPRGAIIHFFTPPVHLYFWDVLYVCLFVCKGSSKLYARCTNQCCQSFCQWVAGTSVAYLFWLFWFKAAFSWH